ncbi:MAG: hypothetical protein ACI9U2_000776 [Bradymonadia bacterium]|jgi:hypothetical protein
MIKRIGSVGLMALLAFTGCDDGDANTTVDGSVIRDMGGEGGAGGMPVGGEGGAGGMPMGGEGGAGGMPMGGEGGEGGMPMGGEGGEGGMPMGGEGGEGGAGGAGGAGGGVVEDIDCGPIEAPANGTCEVTPGSDKLVIQGTLLGPQGLITGGNMRVSAGGIIECVGCDCIDDAATIINCGEAIVSPGLINSHDHITFTQNSPGQWGDERYEHRHDWRRGRNGHTRIPAAGQANGSQVSWGELRQLISGTTSLVGSGGANGLLRNLDRVQEGLMQGDVALDTFPLGDTGGETRNGSCDYPDLPNANVLRDDAWAPHVSEGIDLEARNEFLCLSSDEGIDVTGSNGAFIHGVALTAIDGAILADRQTAIIWSPRSNISLYGHTAPVTMLDTQGILLGLGTDWTPSGSINMQRELACADQLNSDHYNNYFTDRQLWQMATINNAQALAVADGTGSLQVGLTADIAVFAPAGDNPYRAVIEATPATTALVLRGGDPLYGDAGLVEAIPNGDGCEQTELCAVQKTLCLQGEIGQNFAVLSAANAGSYDLTFCGVPPDEPSCTPFRPAEFDGEITADDNDGDGVLNDADNCPNIFNPARPLDGVAQADHDNDGLGDVCDICPIDADSDECSVPDPNDRDADGVPEDIDNCPGLANPDQADGDEDGKGDLCDPCPVADPPGSACPGTIQQVKGNDALLDSQVQVEGVVTVIHAEEGNFFVQMADDATVDGPGFSGIFVFVGNATVAPFPDLNRGQVIRITAQISDFFGQRQLSRVSALEVLGDGVLPTITRVASADVGTGGALAAAHEGTLVEIADAVVTAQNPEAGPGDGDPTNAIVVDDVLRINDLYYAFDPLPAIGVRIPRVAGVLRFANGDSKLEPRDQGDVDQGAPALLSLDPQATIIRVGETRVPTSTQSGLTVRLTAPAPDGGLMIALAFDPAGIADAPDAIMVPAGEISAPIVLRGDAVGATTVTASVAGSDDVTANVTVIASDAQPGMITLTPAAIEVLPGAEFELTLTADVPAPFMFNDADDFDFEPMFVDGAFSATVTLIAPMQEGDYRATIEAGDLSTTALITVSVQPAGADLVINEIDYDQEGGDSAEYAEIYNPTGVAIPLAGVVFEGINGSNGDVYGSYNLSDAGAELAPGAFLILGNAAVLVALPEGVLRIELPNNGLQNGAPDGVRIMRGGEFVDGLSYEGAMDGVTEGTALPDDVFDPGEGSLSRCPDGADSGDNAADFSLRDSTPGVENACN